MRRDAHSKPPRGKAEHRVSVRLSRKQKPASTYTEELSAEERAALELQLAASQQRGRPPSI